MVAPDAPDLAAEAARDYAAALMTVDEALRRAAAAAERYAPHLAGEPTKAARCRHFARMFREQGLSLVALAAHAINPWAADP